MSLLKLNGISMAYGGQEIFDGLSAQINRGDHIGLVGPNGVGKTTLLKILTEALEPTGGSIQRTTGLKIGYLEQHPKYPAGQTVFKEVFAGFGELPKVERELRKAEKALHQADEDSGEDHSELYTQYVDLMNRYETLGGAGAESRVASVLDGLSVPERLWQSKMETLSGGERNLVGLARVLVGGHDIMLLDEPGNHLDFSGLDWLENYLISSETAFIIVSHNRYLLDKVSRSTWELQHRKLTIYGGNYSFYRQEKLQKEAVQEAAFKRAKKDIARLEFTIARLKSWASVYDNPALAKTAKNFERRVEQLEQVEKPVGDGKSVKLRFLTEPPKGNIAIEAIEYKIAFDDLTLLKNVTFLISQGERVAFVGDNGTGKSSLLKAIVHDGDWHSDTLRVGKSVKVGYFAQLEETVDEKHSLIEETMRLTGMLRGNATDLLHRFMFTRDDLEKSVRVLSGGERARLQLAVLVSSDVDCLLLDEPTNHLDIPSREAVEDALEEYPGTLVVVSHDRYFLDKMADRVMHFVPPDLTVYDGNFTQFWAKASKLYESDIKGARHGVMRRSATAADVPLDSAKDKKSKKRFKFDPQRFKELEAEIKRLEDTRPDVEAEFETLTEKGKTVRAENRRKRLTKIDEQLDALYQEWLELGEKKKKW